MARRAPKAAQSAGSQRDRAATTKTPGKNSDDQHSKEHLLEFYRQMVLIRRFEDKSAEMYTKGKIRGFLHLYIGEEAIAVGTMAALDPVFSIGTQIAEPLVAHQGLPWKRALAGAIDLLRMVKINDPEVRVRNYPHELSGGMRQRSSSAASIGPHPDVLIADEPTTALDVTTQRQYLDLLKELQKATGMAIIFITHDISIVGNLCDKLAVFYGGLVVEYGSKDQVLNNPSHPYTKALLKALPILGEKRERLQTIPGEPPHAGNLPPACPFHPRCEQAMDNCKEGDAPPIFDLGYGHQARCWLLEKDDEQYSR